MSKKLKKYASFLRQNHLSKITDYFINQNASDFYSSKKKIKKNKNGLSKEFRQLLKSIENESLLKDGEIELKRFKNEMKDSAIDDNKLATKYINFLKNNKLTLIHYIPFFSNDFITTTELTEEIEKLFTNLEKEIINELNISLEKINTKGISREVPTQTRQKLIKDLELRNLEIQKANEKLIEAKQTLKRNNKELDERVKKSTKELSEVNKRYRAFIDLSTEGIWRYGLLNIEYIDTQLPVDEQINLMYKNVYLVECNDKLAILHGFEKAEDLEGLEFSKTKLSTFNNQNRKSILKEFIKSDYKITHLKTKDVDKDGNIIYLESSIVGIIEDNKLTGAWGIQRDVTEITEAEKSIKQSEARYRFLAENVPLIFWTARPDGYLDFGNQKWFDYTGSNPKEYNNLDWRIFVHPKDVDKTFKNWMHSIQTGEVFQEEYRLRKNSGEYRWHLVRAYPLKNEFGKIIKWMGTSTDIHEQKTYFNKLDKKNKELNKINNELDNLLYTVSHDLKAPVNNIDGLIGALKEGIPNDCLLDEGILQIFQMMKDSVEKFKKSLSEVIDIAKAQKRGEETSEDNNLKDIIEEVIPDLEFLIQEKEPQIKTDFKECQNIHFNKKNLRSIFYNLLSNSIKYSSPDRTPKINISSRKTSKYKILEVKDNGLGFETTNIEEITSRRIYRNIEGSGIGLYILKRIMDNANGKIKLKSKIGIGSTFTFYFPIQSRS